MKLRVIQLVIGLDDDAKDPADWNWRAIFADMSPDYKVLSIVSPSIAPAPCHPKWQLDSQLPSWTVALPPPPTYNTKGMLQ
jgi:hypothetical protein